MGKDQPVQNDSTVHQLQMSLQVPGLPSKKMNEDGAEKTEEEKSLTLKQVKQGGELRASESGQYRVSYSSKKGGKFKALKIAVDGSTEEVEQGTATSKLSKGDLESSPLRTGPTFEYLPKEKQRREKPSPPKSRGAIGFAVPDFGYEYIKGLQNLRENGLLGQNNKSIID